MFPQPDPELAFSQGLTAQEYESSAAQPRGGMNCRCNIHSRASLWNQAEARIFAEITLLLDFHVFPFCFLLLP